MRYDFSMIPFSKEPAMTLKLMLCLLAALPGALLSAPSSLELGASRRISEQLLRDLSGLDGKKTIRGAKALWTQVVVQKFSEDAAAATLESDLKLADMEAQLRKAGLKIMDPAKRSLALGLRPTLVLKVLFEPKGGLVAEQGFYLVLTSASQDVTPLAGEKETMTTWFKATGPIPASANL